MIALLVLLAVPLGYFCRNRMAGYLIYIAAFAHLYTFQTSNLVMEWVNGSDNAFPQDSSPQLLDGTLSYFTFTTLIYLIGLGLVGVGQLLRSRRTRRAGGVDLAEAGR